jgi:hypothetical protein
LRVSRSLSIVATAVAALVALGASNAAAATHCGDISAKAPSGDVWKSDHFTVTHMSCSRGHAVMKAMIRGNHIVGGGYGHYQVVGHAYGFTCRSRKAAVHYFEFSCRNGNASLHTFIADMTR